MSMGVQPTSPTEPAAIAAVVIPRPPRILYENHAVAFAFVLLASLGLAWIANLAADCARTSTSMGLSDSELVVPMIATLAVLVLGSVLERFGAIDVWALFARALAFAPVWASLLFFRFYVPMAPALDALTIGVLIVAVPTLAIVGASRAVEIAKATPRRSFVAIAGIALLWMVALPATPVDIERAPLVRFLVHAT